MKQIERTTTKALLFALKHYLLGINNHLCPKPNASAVQAVRYRINFTPNNLCHISLMA